MHTNKKNTKKRQTKRRQTKRQTKKQTKRQGGMLRQVGTPVLSAVKTIGTEYAKDQGQKIITGKRNVLGDITNTYKNKSPVSPATPIMSRTNSNSIIPKTNNKYTENDENMVLKLTPNAKTNVNTNTNTKNIKPVVTLTNNYYDFEL